MTTSPERCVHRPSPSPTFDIVYCGPMLEHVPGGRRATSDLCRKPAEARRERRSAAMAPRGEAHP